LKRIVVGTTCDVIIGELGLHVITGELLKQRKVDIRGGRYSYECMYILIRGGRYTQPKKNIWGRFT
jgi:hypothetical protein